MGILLPQPDIRQASSEAGHPRLNRWRSGWLRFPNSLRKSAKGGNRTHTAVKPLVFETSAYTSSATLAKKETLSKRLPNSLLLTTTNSSPKGIPPPWQI